jgi:ABC-type transport system involved in cytochrome bd biosynthesis fused ATPase/permease subunit
MVGDGGRQVSAGQLQRIALARGFLRRASLLVLDEPTANVDRESAGTIVDAIAGLRGSTVLVITHAPDLAAVADRVVEVRGGRVAQARARAVATA